MIKKIVRTMFIIFVMLQFLASTQPAIAAEPSSSEYQISPGNSLQINVYYGKKEPLSKKMRVSSRGTIHVPLVGEVHVGGLTLPVLKNKLQQLFEQDYFVDPVVSVSIEEYSTVSIMGQIRKTGIYPIKSRLSILELISLAGGFLHSCDLAKVKVKIIHTNVDGSRQGKVLRVADLMNNVTSDPDVAVLRPGDIVIVSESLF